MNGSAHYSGTTERTKKSSKRFSEFIGRSRPGEARESPPGDQCDRPSLTPLIEHEIIPRLRLALDAIDVRPAAASAEIGEQDVLDFSRHVLEDDLPILKSYVENLRSRGATLRCIYLRLFAPAAGLLGQWWEEDRCDFTEVTIGLCRLHELLQTFSPVFQPHDPARKCGRSAVLVPAPGEQHRFGIVMVVEFFRRAGWHVWGTPPETGRELCAILRARRYEIVGLSMNSEIHLERLARNIRRLRLASRNPRIGVLVGGRIFDEHPELVEQVGADATANDAAQAVNQAEELAAQLTRRGGDRDRAG